MHASAQAHLHLYDGTSAACTKKQMAEVKDAFEAMSTSASVAYEPGPCGGVLAMAMALGPDGETGTHGEHHQDPVTLDVVDGKDPKRRALVWPLDPPLADAGAARVRLVAIHHRVLRPAADQPAGAVVFVVMAVVLLAGLTSVAFPPAAARLLCARVPPQGGPEAARGAAAFLSRDRGLERALRRQEKTQTRLGRFPRAAAAAALAVGVASLGRLVPSAANRAFVPVYRRERAALLRGVSSGKQGVEDWRVHKCVRRPARTDRTCQRELQRHLVVVLVFMAIALARKNLPGCLRPTERGWLDATQTAVLTTR